MKLPLDTTPVDDHQMLLETFAGYRYAECPDLPSRALGVNCVLRGFPLNVSLTSKLSEGSRKFRT